MGCQMWIEYLVRHLPGSETHHLNRLDSRSYRNPGPFLRLLPTAFQKQNYPPQSRYRNRFQFRQDQFLP